MQGAIKNCISVKGSEITSVENALLQSEPKMQLESTDSLISVDSPLCDRKEVVCFLRTCKSGAYLITVATTKLDGEMGN